MTFFTRRPQNTGQNYTDPLSGLLSDKTIYISTGGGQVPPPLPMPAGAHAVRQSISYQTNALQIIGDTDLHV